MVTFLHFYILTVFYFFTFQNILSLILGSVSTILLSWLKSRNKMFACSVLVTWLFWLEVSSRGFAFYIQDIVRGGTLVYGVSTQNSASISSTTWIGILFWLIQQLSVFLHSVIEKDIWWNKYCSLVNNFVKMICYRILLQSLTETLLPERRERFSNQ